MAEALAPEISAGARELMARHWPGPLTLVLRAAPHVPASTDGRDRDHRCADSGPCRRARLVSAAGLPVTAPSANPSDHPPPITAESVREYFGDSLDLILDGGPTAGGPASTVADCTVWPPRILRRGTVRL